MVQAAAAAVWGCATSSRTRRLLTELGAVQALLAVLQQSLTMSAAPPADTSSMEVATASVPVGRDQLQVRMPCKVVRPYTTVAMQSHCAYFMEVEPQHVSCTASTHCLNGSHNWIYASGPCSASGELMHCHAMHDGGTLLQWACIVHVQQNLTMSAVLALSTSSMVVITVSESEAMGLAQLQVDACTVEPCVD